MVSKHQVVSFGDRAERGAALAGGALACVLLWATAVFGTRATLSHLLVPTMGVGLLIAWRKLGFATS